MIIHYTFHSDSHLLHPSLWVYTLCRSSAESKPVLLLPLEVTGYIHLYLICGESVGKDIKYSICLVLTLSLYTENHCL